MRDSILSAAFAHCLLFIVFLRQVYNHSSGTFACTKLYVQISRNEIGDLIQGVTGPGTGKAQLQSRRETARKAVEERRFNAASRANKKEPRLQPLRLGPRAPQTQPRSGDIRQPGAQAPGRQKRNRTESRRDGRKLLAYICLISQRCTIRNDEPQRHDPLSTSSHRVARAGCPTLRGFRRVGTSAKRSTMI